MSQQINLFNPAFVQKRQQFSLATMLQGLGVILLGALGMYGYALYQVQQMEQQVAESARLFNTEQVRLAGLAAEFSPQRNNQILQEEVQRLEQQIGEQAGLVDVLKAGVQDNGAGYSEYMRAFSRQLVQGLWLTGFTIAGDGAQLTLNGAVMHPGLLPEYIQRLRREPVMEGKTFAALQMQQAKPDKSGKPGSAPRYVEFVLRSSAEEVKKE